MCEVGTTAKKALRDYTGTEVADAIREHSSIKFSECQLKRIEGSDNPTGEVIIILLHEMRYDGNLTNYFAELGLTERVKRVHTEW